MATKHMKPNPFYPSGARMKKETPIKYNAVQLVDPVTDKPTSVSLRYAREKGASSKTRKQMFRLTEANSLVPVPVPDDAWKDQKVRE